MGETVSNGTKSKMNKRQKKRNENKKKALPVKNVPNKPAPVFIKANLNIVDEDEQDVQNILISLVTKQEQ